MTRHKLQFFFLTFVNILVIFSCKNNPTNFGDRPGRPQLIATPEPVALTEIGIDAFTSQNELEGIQLDWRHGAGAIPDSFRVFRRAEEEEEFGLQAVVGNEFTLLPNDTLFSFVDTDSIEVNVRYSYYLTALHANGNESEPSDTLDYMLIPKPENLGVDRSHPARPKFFWSNVIFGNYVLKVIEANSDKRVWVTLIENSFGAVTSVQFNYDSKADQDSLRKGIRYQWRVDALGTEANSGSESIWKEYEY